MTYREFLESKIELAQDSGFVVDPAKINKALKPHQRDAVCWALKGGRRALFESFGLGKTIQEIEFCHQAADHCVGRALIVLPLGVKQEFTRDAVDILGYERPEYCRTMEEVEQSTSQIVLTNYERVRDGDIRPEYFAATSLDEASVLRSFGSKTYQTFLEKFKNVPYKLVATATPSPNKYKELIHYAGYLEVMESNSIDLIHTSIPFGNHYEYSANYNDFGHNQDTDRFFEQMDFLTPELLRPGRVAAIHVKDRVLFGNATGTGMPTIEPFHAQCISHYMKHGFQYFGMITVVTDVVRENNQTYRLGWTEQCKDGSKMGVGCPEYILLFRKLPTDRSTAYADDPVKKSKEDYTRAQWQIDAHGYWRSSGDRLISKEELESISVDNLQAVYREYSREHIYSYEEHVELAKKLDENGKLPATFMVVAPGSWNQMGTA